MTGTTQLNAANITWMVFFSTHLPHFHSPPPLVFLTAPHPHPSHTITLPHTTHAHPQTGGQINLQGAIHVQNLTVTSKLTNTTGNFTLTGANLTVSSAYEANSPTTRIFLGGRGEGKEELEEERGKRSERSRKWRGEGFSLSKNRKN
jgi:hypothetical protein